MSVVAKIIEKSFNQSITSLLKSQLSKQKQLINSPLGILIHYSVTAPVVYAGWQRWPVGDDFRVNSDKVVRYMYYRNQPLN